MSGWLDSLFGNLPPPSPPKRPASRGALLGARYQGMPDTTAPIEDYRYNQLAGFTPKPTPADPYAALRASGQVGPNDKLYSSDQWDWLQAHAGGAAPPEGFGALTMPQDPSFALDPSVKAQIKAWQRFTNPYAPGSMSSRYPDLPTPMPSPGQRTGPQLTPDQIASALQYWGGAQ